MVTFLPIHQLKLVLDLVTPEGCNVHVKEDRLGIEPATSNHKSNDLLLHHSVLVLLVGQKEGHVAHRKSVLIILESHYPVRDATKLKKL